MIITYTVALDTVQSALPKNKYILSIKLNPRHTRHPSKQQQHILYFGPWSDDRKQHSLTNLSQAPKEVVDTNLQMILYEGRYLICIKLRRQK